MEIAIIGVGLHPFGRHEGKSGLDMGVYAARQALEDAGVEWKDIQSAFGGSMSSGTADSLLRELGPTSIQFTNVFNGCATAGASVMNASLMIESGRSDIALAVGFDKHERGMFAFDPKTMKLPDWFANIGLCLSTQFFAMKTKRYMHDYGISDDSLIRVAVKNALNGSLTPHAWRRTAADYDTVANSMMLNDPLRKFMFCSPSEGAAAAVLCRADIARNYTKKPIYIRGLTVRTRKYGSLEVYQPSNALEDAPSPTEIACRDAFERASVDPAEIQVAQIQDTDSGSEIIHMAETGLCRHGEQEKLIRDNETGINGRIPINTDGGLMANGEPVGASGLRQIYEICMQLRGEAGKRQVPNNPKIGMTHVYGGPGLSAVAILQR